MLFQKDPTNEQLFGDARRLIDLLENEYWIYSPQFDVWENTTAGQIDRVYDKLPETAREKIAKLRTASDKMTSGETTPLTRFRRWVYMLVYTMEWRVSFLRNQLGNFRRMCSFGANIAYLRLMLDPYTSYRPAVSNCTRNIDSSEIRNIQTALKTHLDVDDEASEDVASLFRQVKEIRKDCLDD